MSRVDKNIQRKIRKKKRKIISKILFIFIMTINLSICIFIIEQNAKKMLGEDTYNIEENLNNMYEFLEDTLDTITDNTKKLISQLNI